MPVFWLQAFGSQCRWRSRAGVLHAFWLAALLWLCLQPGMAWALTLKDAKLTQQQDHLSITLLFDQPVAHTLFTLDNPDRLVLDVPDVTITAPLQRLSKASSLIRAVRHGLFKPGQRRIVLDLSGPVQAPQWNSGAVEGEGYALVIRLQPRGQWVQPQQGVAAPPPPASASHLPAAPSSQGLPARLPAPAPMLAEPVTASSTQPAPNGIDWSQVVPVFKPLVTRAHWRTFHFKGMPRPILVVTPVFKPLEMCARPPIVVIDAGHGGKDPGAISSKGTQEKIIALRYARGLRDALNATGKYFAKLTRDDDRFLHLRERIAIAKKMEGDIFISIHADSAPNPLAHGFSVYTLSEDASDAEAASLAARENKADILMDVDLSHESRDVASILIDLAQRETKNKSSELAESFVQHMRPFAQPRKHTHRYAGFAVLKSPDIPSVLVELGFISNKEDEQKLLNPDYQKQLLGAMVRSIEQYYRRYQPDMFK